MLFKVVRAQLIVVSSNAVATVYAFFSSDGRNAVLFVCVALFFEEKKKEVALSHFSGVYSVLQHSLSRALARHSSQRMIIIWLYKGVCITNSRIYI